MSQASEAPTQRWSGAGARPASQPAGGGGAGAGGRGDETTSLTRWMWVWITIGIIVVVVVIGFLLGIVGALQSINDALANATGNLAGSEAIEGDVNPLPARIDTINQNLSQIDSALAPIPGQAEDTIGLLSSIEGSLSTIDSSLADTSASLIDTNSMLGGITNSLQDTSGTLINTSDTLQTVLGQLTSIDQNLESAQRTAPEIPENVGTSGIHPRVAVANDVLRAARGDTSAIHADLVQVNKHLTSICQALPLPGSC